MEVGILFIRRIVAPHIHQRVVGGTAHDGVDMSIGVVANEISIVEPHHTTDAQTALQLFLNLLFS